MEKITITIKTVNQAFEYGANYELARILRDLADKLERNDNVSSVRDSNGNKVGIIEYE